MSLFFDIVFIPLLVSNRCGGGTYPIIRTVSDILKTGKACGSSAGAKQMFVFNPSLFKVPPQQLLPHQLSPMRQQQQPLEVRDMSHHDLSPGKVSVETVNHFSLERVAGAGHLGPLSISLLLLRWHRLSWRSRRTCP